jgi:hypothetical protein
MRFEQDVENAFPQSDRVRFKNLSKKDKPDKNKPGNTSGSKKKVQCGSKRSKKAGGQRPRNRLAKKKSKV